MYLGEMNNPLETESVPLASVVLSRFTGGQIEIQPLHDILHMLLRDSLRLARGSKPAWSPSTALGSCKTFQGAPESLHGRDHPAGRDWNLQTLGRSRYDVFRKVRNMDSSRLVLIAFRDDLG